MSLKVVVVVVLVVVVLVVAVLVLDTLCKTFQISYSRTYCRWHL